MVAFRDAIIRRTLQVRSRTAVVHALKILWVLFILWFELGTFLWSVAWCRWPKQVGSSGGASFHVLLVADPQVPRPYRGWAPGPTWLRHHVVNHNLRKSWYAAKTLRPQAVVFLGDMLRHGRQIKDMVSYGEYFTHFRSIFTVDPAVSVHYIPGNRDVGLGSSHTFSAHARQRYNAYFGPTNQLVTLGNHTLVLLDAPALVEEDFRRHNAQAKFSNWLSVQGGSIRFIYSVATTIGDRPIVLFTHLPLARPDTASCGPLRERGSIRRGVERGYPSLLGRETSKFLIENLQPTVIFSADDNDYCEYVHAAPSDLNLSSVREVTVKSFSMATRLRRPGFQLLSLFTPEDSNAASAQPSHADTLCLLPGQARMYTHGYVPLLLCTLFLLLFVNMRRPRPRLPHGSGAPGWDDDALLALREAGGVPAPTPSPTAPSPPASPIMYKASHARPPALRSASTLTPAVFASQPATPILSPLLSPMYSAGHGEEEEDGQELLIWPGHTQQAQAARSHLSPRGNGIDVTLKANDDAYGEDSRAMDSAYFLPSPAARRTTSPKRLIWLRTAAGARPSLHASRIAALSRPVLAAVWLVWRGGSRRPRTLRGRVGQDVWQVAALPALVYIVIATWVVR